MQTLRIVVTGARGQLGRSLLQIGKELFPQIELVPTDYEELDVTQQGALEQFLSTRPSLLPTLLINCAAYTAVDQAESDDEAAYQLNSFAPAYLAMSCAMLDMMMIHISTDYVFDGTAHKPYLEDEKMSPISVYGETKAVGEENVHRMIGLRGLVVRTSWLYSNFGCNFVSTMLRLSRERQEIEVVADQIGSPTYAGHLAEALLRIATSSIERGYFPVDTIHYSNSGSCSWYELAQTAIQLMGDEGCRIIPTKSADYTNVAKRPLYSVLSHRYLEEYFDITPPTWQEGLLALHSRAELLK